MLFCPACNPPTQHETPPIKSLPSAAETTNDGSTQSELQPAQVIELCRQQSWRRLELPNARINRAAWHALRANHELTHLRLGITELVDEDFRDLARDWPRLCSLNIAGVAAGDAALAAAAQCPELELLRFGSSHISDDGLASLANHKNLRFLILTNARITGTGLRYLHQLKKLESLYLAGNDVSEPTRKELQKALPDLHPDW